MTAGAGSPWGFDRLEAGNLDFYVRPGEGRIVVAALEKGPDRILAEASAVQAPVAAEGRPVTGRGAVAFIPLGDGRPAVLRKYRRGGLAGRLLPDLFAGPSRLLRELEVCLSALAAGAPVATPLAGVFLRRGLLGSLWLLTLEIGGAVPMSRALQGASPSRAAGLLRSAGRTARRCHDAGLVHADLNLGNILIREGGDSGDSAEEAVLIDLDRADFRPKGAEIGERFANLSRLARSYEKLCGTDGPWGPHPLPRLIAAYSAGDAALEQGLCRLVPAHEKSMRWHRIGWRLSATLGGRAAAGP